MDLMLEIKIEREWNDRCHVGASRTLFAITCKTPLGDIQKKRQQELLQEGGVRAKETLFPIVSVSQFYILIAWRNTSLSDWFWCSFLSQKWKQSFSNKRLVLWDRSPICKSDGQFSILILLNPSAGFNWIGHFCFIRHVLYSLFRTSNSLPTTSLTPLFQPLWLIFHTSLTSKCWSAPA